MAGSRPSGFKYEVLIGEHDKPERLTGDTKETLAAAGMVVNGKVNIKGVSAKMLRRMKTEYVDCPVLKEEVTFLKCFVCPNFQSRVRGRVLCRGDPL